MSEGLSEEEYLDEVESNAETLAEYARQDVERDTAYEDHEQAALDLAEDVLHAHNWFARSYHGPADHGAIIEHAMEHDPDIHRFGDIEAYLDSDDPAEVVKRMAYAAFEAHVIERALELLSAEA